MNDPITKEQVIAAYYAAPDFVRMAFNDPKTTDLIKSFGTTYNLHIDQLGVIGKEVGYLLLGLVDPAKFASRLKNSGFSDALIATISKELNEKVFIPIRQKEKNDSEKKVAERASPPIPAAVPQPAPQEVPLPPKPAMPSPARMSPPERSAGGSLSDVLRTVMKEKQAVVPPERTLPREDPAALLADHEEPHIDIRVAREEAQQGTLPSSAMPSPQESTVPVPPPIPLTPKISPPTPKTPPPAPITSYTKDPYREPIDEDTEA